MCIIYLPLKLYLHLLSARLCILLAYSSYCAGDYDSFVTSDCFTWYVSGDSLLTRPVFLQTLSVSFIQGA